MGEIYERWHEKPDISGLPDDPWDDPWAYTGLLTRNLAINITPPLWGAIKSEVYRVFR